MNPELSAMIVKANTYESNGMFVNLSPLLKYVEACVVEPNPEKLDAAIKQCIVELNTFPAIRVLRAAYRARNNCAPWRPFAVKTYHDYVKKVGEEKARTDMSGLTEGFVS